VLVFLLVFRLAVPPPKTKNNKHRTLPLKSYLSSRSRTAYSYCTFHWVGLAPGGSPKNLSPPCLARPAAATAAGTEPPVLHGNKGRYDGAGDDGEIQAEVRHHCILQHHAGIGGPPASLLVRNQA